MRTIAIAVWLGLICLGPHSVEVKAQSVRRQSPRTEAERQAWLENRHREIERRQAEIKKETEKINRSVMKQILDVDDVAWEKIEPTLKAIDQLQAEAKAAMRIGVSARGGSSSGGSSSGGSSSSGSSSGSSSSRRSSSGGGSGGSSQSSGGSGGSSGGSSLDDSLHPERSITKGNMTYTWGWGHSSRVRDESLTAGQRACQALLDELERPKPDPGMVAEKVKKIQDIRKRATEQLTDAQQHLREALTEQQQNVMVLMGYLE